jgi:hypothetical protein
VKQAIITDVQWIIGDVDTGLHRTRQETTGSIHRPVTVKQALSHW